MTPYELFKQEKLDDAIDQAVSEVKSHPADVDRRLLFCDLLCMAGDLERADKQLETILQQDASLSVGISLYRHLIRAEMARKQFHELGRVPEFMEDVSETLQLHLRASIAAREGAMKEAADLLAQAEQGRDQLSGSCDGIPFEDFRDLDDLSAPLLEVLTSTGKYYWVGLEKIESLEFGEPRQLRDLIWRPTSMVIRDGPDAVIYVPVRYAGSEVSDDPAIRIGQGTNWIETVDGPTRGVGQRMFLVGDEDKSIMSIRNIELNSAADATN